MAGKPTAGHSKRRSVAKTSAQESRRIIDEAEAKRKAKAKAKKKKAPK